MQKLHKAVFPVAGFGTRFLPATKAMPKELLPIVDKPLIQYAVEEAIAAGIDTLIHYPIPPHLQTAYQSSGWKKGSFPVTEKMSDELLSLPIGPHINYQKVDYVCEVLIKALKE